MSYVSDELALLSSLRFAPIDAKLYRNSPSSESVLATSNRHATRLQGHLQTLITAQQGALFDGVGDISAIRRDLLDTMTRLHRVVASSVDEHRCESIKLMGQREDCDVTERKIEALLAPHLSKDEDEEEASYTRHSSELKSIEAEIHQAKSRLVILERRRVEVKGTLRDLEIARARKNLKVQGEVKALRQLPTRASLSASIAKVQGIIDLEESEVAGLGDGTALFSDIVIYLSAREADLVKSLNQDEREQVADTINIVIRKLDAWLDIIREKGWKLLEVVVGSERESYERAKRMIK